MTPFSNFDLDDVVALAFEHTAGVISHAVEADLAAVDAHEWVTASLAVSGPWECSMSLCVDLTLATSLTESMWDQADVSAADVDDAIGELANVIAGGVKGMTPHPGCELSTPVVTRGALPKMHATMQRSYLVTNRPVILFVSL